MQAIENISDGIIITYIEKECNIRIMVKSNFSFFTIHKNSECLYNGYSENFSDVLKEVYEMMVNL